MIWEQLKEDLMITDLEAASNTDVFKALGGLLTEKGYTKDTYVNALIEREAEYPTGLDLMEVGVAIPHTDASHVNKNAIAIATLKNPVEWIQMGSDDEPVGVKMVFMLSLASKGHIEELQQIIGIIQDIELVKKMIEMKDPAAIIAAIKEKESTM